MAEGAEVIQESCQPGQASRLRSLRVRPEGARHHGGLSFPSRHQETVGSRCLGGNHSGPGALTQPCSRRGRQAIQGLPGCPSRARGVPGRGSHPPACEICLVSTLCSHEDRGLQPPPCPAPSLSRVCTVRTIQTLGGIPSPGARAVGTGGEKGVEGAEGRPACRALPRGRGGWRPGRCFSEAGITCRGTGRSRVSWAEQCLWAVGLSVSLKCPQEGDLFTKAAA